MKRLAATLLIVLVTNASAIAQEPDASAHLAHPDTAEKNFTRRVTPLGSRFSPT